MRAERTPTHGGRRITRVVINGPGVRDSLMTMAKVGAMSNGRVSRAILIDEDKRSAI